MIVPNRARVVLVGLGVVAGLTACTTHPAAPVTQHPTVPSSAATADTAQLTLTDLEPSWQVPGPAWVDLPLVGEDADLIVADLPTDPDPTAGTTGRVVEILRETAVYAADPDYGDPESTLPVARLSPWTASTGTALPIFETTVDGTWGMVPVMARTGLPGAGATGQAVGWIDLRSPRVHVTEQSRQVVVDVDARTLTVLDNDHVVYEETVAVGSPATPTPPGRTGITATYVDPSAVYTEGAPVIALARFSDVTDAFTPVGGTDPVAPLIAFHTWWGTEPTDAASNGCVRTSPETLAVLAAVPSGTPVTIL